MQTSKETGKVTTFWKYRFILSDFYSNLGIFGEIKVKTLITNHVF